MNSASSGTSASEQLTFCVIDLLLAIFQDRVDLVELVRIFTVCNDGGQVCARAEEGTINLTQGSSDPSPRC